MVKPHVALILAVLMLGIAGCKKETPPPVPPVRSVSVPGGLAELPPQP